LGYLFFLLLSLWRFSVQSDRCLCFQSHDKPALRDAINDHEDMTTTVVSGPMTLQVSLLRAHATPYEVCELAVVALGSLLQKIATMQINQSQGHQYG
jgi:hypothetical protein